MPQEYAIIDIETTGRSGAGQKVTEIAIIIHDGKKVIDEYQTLVNPETSIPYSITQLTGIHDEMVMHSPKFFEIAKKVYKMTEGRIFVAHNVAFDYGVLRGEFASLGGTFERKQLCTVKLARKLLPGHGSYSLGKLCTDLGISIHGRHRAFGDAEATVKLLEIMFGKAEDLGMEDLSLESVANIPKIPPQLDRDTYRSLPQATGVYYIYDASQTLVYIGKAKNIRQRMLSHFNDKSRKEKSLFEATADIRYVLTGSELIALLMESDEIKKHQPKFNRALKQTKATYGLYAYENQKGVLQLSVAKLQAGSLALNTFVGLARATKFLEQAVASYRLCPKYCGLEKTQDSCFASKIKKCNGVCADRESVVDYNVRVEELIDDLILKREDFYIEEPGRTADEIGIVQIKQGEYQGYGYVSSSDQNTGYEGYENCIEKKDNDSDASKIILGYLKKQREHNASR
ncbi:exonuclease domain-containing protein [Reichenbachiella carrageenanivorans]|uniref:Exonuclease domain-containing protein n=1 Tax=Reichenbachiella carrageenanivorans TaxID=2979869 RepID=A0ABY6D6H7_9BACT|nr:exonuclease domain-containing protein [Reichenbachiella carrageenanivorans]UXX80683.1 exonuclease domain-containing protein [Reichenbachiella carrageenanivorans]